MHADSSLSPLNSVSSRRLPVLPASACARLTCATTIARCPRTRRSTRPPCGRARAHSRGEPGHRAWWCSTSSCRYSAKFRFATVSSDSGCAYHRHRCCPRSWPAPAQPSAAGRLTNLVVRRASDQRSRGVHRTAENATQVVVGALRVLVVVLREEGILWCWINERWDYGSQRRNQLFSSKIVREWKRPASGRPAGAPRTVSARLLCVNTRLGREVVLSHPCGNDDRCGHSRACSAMCKNEKWVGFWCNCAVEQTVWSRSGRYNEGIGHVLGQDIARCRLRGCDK